MSIDKIAFQSLEQSQQLPPAKKEEVKNVPDNEEDKEKANASKYMIGAAALAGVIAVGIIGHKNNWWRKAQDVGEDIVKKGSDTLQSGERKAGQTAEDAASAGSKADDIQTPNPNESSTPKPKSQPEEKADLVSKEEPQVKEPEMKKPVEEKTPVEPPKQEEIPVEPPKPELKGGDLIKSNLESLDPKMTEEEIRKILSETESEILHLPESERIQYFNDYLNGLKKVQGALPEKLSGFEEQNLFEIIDMLPVEYIGQYGDILLNFAKENPKFEAPVVIKLLNSAHNLSFTSSSTAEQEGLKLMKSLVNSGLKHDGSIYQHSYTYAIDNLRPDDSNKMFSDTRKQYLRLSFDFDLQSGMDEFYAKKALDSIWEKPDVYRIVMGNPPVKLDEAVRNSYNKLKGKTLDYKSVNFDTFFANHDKNEQVLLCREFIENAPDEMLPQLADKYFDALKQQHVPQNYEALNLSRDLIDSVPAEMRSKFFEKYFDILKKYTPEDLDTLSNAFFPNNLEMAEQFVKFGKENPQYRKLINHGFIARIDEGNFKNDDYITLLKMLKENHEFDNYTLMRLGDLFQIKEGASGYIDGVYVGDEIALEFRRTAFDLWTQHGGVTERIAKKFLNDEYNFYDHIPAGLNMSREEFLNRISASVKKD